MSSPPLPAVVADVPLAAAVARLLEGRVELLPWSTLDSGSHPQVAGIYTLGHPPVDGARIARAPNLRVISNYGVGVDHIDLAAAATHDIPVGHTPFVLDGATADMAMALLLAAGRRLVEGDRLARSPGWTTHDPGELIGREVHGATLGIVGMGRIGTQVARRARGFGMTVLYHNRHPRPEAEEQLGALYLPLEELLALADYVVLCVPLTDATRHLIGPAELAQMKPTATLVNTARGPVVDTEALTEALRSGRLYAAALDVTDPEPLPRDHPLLTLENVTLMPHLGSATEQTRQRMAEFSVENLLAGLQGEQLTCRVKA